MKKRVLLLPLLASLLLSGCGGSGGTSGPGYVDGDIKINISEDDVKDLKVNITLWSPITGPDSGYLQNLITAWNSKFSNNVKLTSDPLSEDAHYTRLTTSLTDSSTADLVMIHRSRVAQFQKTGKMRDITSIVSDAGIKKENYLSSFWDSNLFDDKLYALTYDLLPTLLYYNKKLIPNGYSEQDILSPDFTVEKMIEMMKKAYVDNSVPSKITYGLAFNYAYTENPFLSFLYQQGQKPVEASNPTKPLFNNEKGVAAATALRDLPLATNEDGKKVASKSGTDHLNVFTQGRALFTIDGLWQSTTAINHNDRLDTGLAFLPKVNSSISDRLAYGDSHCFSIFENASKSAEKDKAISLLLKYFVDNTSYWCKGGKASVRNDAASEDSYKQLEWAFVSDNLDKIRLPESIYTNNAITSRIGVYCSKLCEGKLSDVQKALDDCAQEAEELAKKA